MPSRGAVLGDDTLEFQQNSKEPSLSRGTFSRRLSSPLPEATGQGRTIPGGQDLQGHCWFCRRFAGLSGAWVEAIEWPKSERCTSSCSSATNVLSGPGQGTASPPSSSAVTKRLPPGGHDAKPFTWFPPLTPHSSLRCQGWRHPVRQIRKHEMRVVPHVGSVPGGSDAGAFCTALLPWFNLDRV